MSFLSCMYCGGALAVFWALADRNAAADHMGYCGDWETERITPRRP